MPFLRNDIQGLVALFFKRVFFENKGNIIFVFFINYSCYLNLMFYVFLGFI